MQKLKAPFPYFGGKSRWSDMVWRRFGNPDIFCEPFAGSLAVLLGCPKPAKKEVVCDTSGMICNFWRAVAAEPDAVAEQAIYPTFHQDLTSRHKWLVAWRAEHAQRLSDDPHFYDVKAAAWWVWGMSLWIGSGWCDPKGGGNIPWVDAGKGGGRGVACGKVANAVPDIIPEVKDGGSGRGVAAGKITDKIPEVHQSGSGRCVAVGKIADTRPQASAIRGQKLALQSSWTENPHDIIPHVKPSCGGGGVSTQGKAGRVHDIIPHATKESGQGISAQRVADHIPSPGDGKTGAGLGVSTQTMSVSGKTDDIDVSDIRPSAGKGVGGVGISMQSTPVDIRPQSHGRGVSIQNNDVGDKRPTPGARGVSTQNSDVGGSQRTEAARQYVKEWFWKLQDRLLRVVVLNRPWESGVTKAMLSDYEKDKSSQKWNRCIFLDPPYVVAERSNNIYESDRDGTSDSVAQASYKWAVENGNRFRIAYACHENDFPLPPDWTMETMSFSGSSTEKMDCVMFSPACLDMRENQFDFGD